MANAYWYYRIWGHNAIHNHRITQRLRITGRTIAVALVLATAAACGDSEEGGSNNSAVCGNGVVEADEACDGSNLNGQSCESLGQGFTGGVLACDGCQFDTSGCVTCGNGIAEAGEACDGSDLDGQSCDSLGQGFTAGALACDGCQFDTSGCTTCGNGNLEPGEACDDGNTVGGDGCSSACAWEFVCGDQVCEASIGETCLLCPGDCCPDCGNGVIDPGERCDGAALGGVRCEDFCYEGGTLGCSAWCDFDFTGCTGTAPVCGDGVAECGEQCDGADLRGYTCEALGHGAGTLACHADCTHDLSACGPPLIYLETDFEDPAAMAGWVLGGIWERGTPTMASEPTTPHSGFNVIGTVIGGNYSGSNQYLTDLAQTPTIDLGAAFAPVLRFYMWVNTEAGWDCGALWISVNGGPWNHNSSPSPPYNEIEGGYGCWGGTGVLAWQEVHVDLTSYAGQTIRIGFGFYSDSIVNYTGWYIDDVVVAEPGALP